MGGGRGKEAMRLDLDEEDVEEEADASVDLEDVLLLLFSRLSPRDVARALIDEPTVVARLKEN